MKEPIHLWELERHYLPALVDLDRIISSLERLAWEREFPKHGDVRATDEALSSPLYDDPIARWRNTLLGVRNEVAALCGVKPRTIHDPSPNALGYTYNGDLQLPHPKDLHSTQFRVVA